MRILHSVFFFLFLINVHWGQHHEALLYTVDDGLPETTCTNLHIDRTGRLWIAFVGGSVCHFDGTEFQEMMTINGNRSKSRGAFYENDHGLWFINEEGEIALKRYQKFRMINHDHLHFKILAHRKGSTYGIDEEAHFYEFNLGSESFERKFQLTQLKSAIGAATSFRFLNLNTTNDILIQLVFSGGRRSVYRVGLDGDVELIPSEKNVIGVIPSGLLLEDKHRRLYFKENSSDDIVPLLGKNNFAYHKGEYPLGRRQFLHLASTTKSHIRRKHVYL